jgi:hypothetical protein
MKNIVFLVSNLKVLIEWFEGMCSMNLQISGSIIRKKAGRVALKLGLHYFKAFNGWLVRFRKCHRLTYKNMCSRSDSVYKNMVYSWKIHLSPEHNFG